jgi:heterodisulfide reductase subunit A
MSEGTPHSSNGTRIGVYVCHCGTNIAKTVDVVAVAASAATRPGVAVARDYRFMCSEPGQELIQRDIREHGLTRVVVAACSPLMHEPTFRKAVERAGLALVVGGGIAGIEAALQMADAGIEVVLVERDSSIGGHMASFDKTFPTLDCAACILTPKMVAVAQHPNIRLITYAEIEKVDGFVGNFKVTVRRKPRYVDVTKCNSCGTCYEACPSRPHPLHRRMILGDRVYKEGTPRVLAPADKHVHRVSRAGLPENRGARP